MEALDVTLEWILMVSLSPIAAIFLTLLALLSVLLPILKASLLLLIVAINTPFAVMFNVSALSLYKAFSLVKSRGIQAEIWRLTDPRVTVGIEFQVIVSDFFKAMAGELLLILSTGVITFYTAPLLVFFMSVAVGVAAILLKWLNTKSLSKIAFSCLCDGYGLSPMTFLFSYIGLFDIGCHPIAKCSFTASEAFLFTNDENRTPFNTDTAEDPRSHQKIDFPKYNAFERGLFELSPRIDVKIESNWVLKSSMVLKLSGVDLEICKYPVERLELPEDYTKQTELLSFLQTLAKKDGFVTDKLRGRYENSFTLSQIVDGVGANEGYRTVAPNEAKFVVAGYASSGCCHLARCSS